MFVRIGGIDQWITIKGDDCNNPVVLFLHGGPGDALSPFADSALRTPHLTSEHNTRLQTILILCIFGD
jgi:hypothetical protein